MKKRWRLVWYQNNWPTWQYAKNNQFKRIVRNLNSKALTAEALAAEDDVLTDPGVLAGAADFSLLLFDFFETRLLADTGPSLWNKATENTSLRHKWKCILHNVSSNLKKKPLHRHQRSTCRPNTCAKHRRFQTLIVGEKSSFFAALLVSWLLSQSFLIGPQWSNVSQGVSLLQIGLQLKYRNFRVYRSASISISDGFS